MSTLNLRAGSRFTLALLCAAAICGAALADVQTTTPLRHGLDPSFVAVVGPNWEDDPVTAIEDLVLLPDGKILVAGSDPNLIRLNPNGSVDQSFAPSYDGPYWILDLDMLPNGQMYISTAEGFLRIGASDGQVLRLNADGSQDRSFAPPPLEYYDNYEPQPTVRMEPLPDGRLYVDKHHQGTPDAVPLEAWTRLLSDGSIDTGFTVNGRYVDAIHAVDAQGRAYFSNLLASDGTVEPLPLARLLPDDTIDPSFTPPPLGNFTDVRVALQADGGILVLGYTQPPVGPGTLDIVRLQEDGTPDPSFSFTSTQPCCSFDDSITPLANGRFLLNGKQRFLANGAPDPSFEPFPLEWPGPIVEQPDGKLVVGGGFAEAGIPPRRHVARLLADDSPAPRGGPLCVMRRYTGNITYGGLDPRSDTYFEAGSTFTLHSRSDDAFSVFVSSYDDGEDAVLDDIGDSYTVTSLGKYFVGFKGPLDTSQYDWVVIEMCGPVYPGATESPTASASVTATASPSATPSASPGPSVTATTTASPSPTPSASPGPSATATATSSPGPSATATTAPQPAPDSTLFLPLIQQ